MKNNADAGCAILMEVATGEIKAIVNLKKADSGYYREDFNYAIGYATEPGSTFKLVSMMAGIEDGYIDLDDTVDATNGRTSYAPGLIMRDSHEGLNKITAKHAFEESSNVGVSKLIQKYYRKINRHLLTVYIKCILEINLIFRLLERLHRLSNQLRIRDGVKFRCLTCLLAMKQW